ncbi:MAG: CesT family type III secretion system chaperone [Gammaproteobacteria bacterium]
MPFKDLIEQLAYRLGIKEIRPDAQGEYRFVFDRELMVYCAQAGRALLLRGVIGKRSGTARDAADQLQTLLRQNLARLKEQQEVMSLASDTDEFILYRLLPLETTRIDDLEQALGGYLNHLEFWRHTFTGAIRRGPALPLLFP